MNGKWLVLTILLALAGVTAYEYVLLQGHAPA
jgi:hypothetical protein